LFRHYATDKAFVSDKDKEATVGTSAEEAGVISEKEAKEIESCSSPRPQELFSEEREKGRLTARWDVFSGFATTAGRSWSYGDEWLGIFLTDDNLPTAAVFVLELLLQPGLEDVGEVWTLGGGVTGEDERLAGGDHGKDLVLAQRKQSEREPGRWARKYELDEEDLGKGREEKELTWDILVEKGYKRASTWVIQSNRGRKEELTLQ
jgi:hypothetical protein